MVSDLPFLLEQEIKLFQRSRCFVTKPEEPCSQGSIAVADWILTVCLSDDGSD